MSIKVNNLQCIYSMTLVYQIDYYNDTNTLLKDKC